jgi:hypothetical protein
MELYLDPAPAAEAAARQLNSAEQIDGWTRAARADFEEQLTRHNPAARQKTLQDNKNVIDGLVKAAREKSIAEREAPMAERRALLDAAVQKADQLALIARSPRALLEAEVSKDPAKFAGYSDVLRDANPATLSTYGAMLLADPNNLPLAAALCRALDRLPKELQPFSPGAIAEAAAGPRWKALQTAAAQIRYHRERASVYERSARRGEPVTGDQKIRLALLAKSAELDPQVPHSEPVAIRRHAIDRISDGLKKMDEA